MAEETLSRAVVQYLAKGRSSFPRSNEHAVAALAGDDAGSMLARVRGIIDEMLAIEIDWSESILSEGARTARATMASQHPELSDEALDALQWMFSFSWR